MNYQLIEKESQFDQLQPTKGVLHGVVFKGINFSGVQSLFKDWVFDDCLFLGCALPDAIRQNMEPTCLEFPSINVPYNVFRTSLYNARQLYGNYFIDRPDEYYDQQVYRHYLHKGKQAKDVVETLARSLHDRSISDAMNQFLAQFNERQIIGIMGGHSLCRRDSMYARVAFISKTLTENGFLMISGGGPGAMEATHLGAWMAGRTLDEFRDAVHILRIADTFQDPEWLSTAFQVIEKYPQQQYVSLGIPTWLYGHEPSTPFATHIAKYFDNSIREDTILTIACGGIIYTPGSAGTLQEIFQDAVQNHYLSFGYASPMTFLGVEYWTHEMPVYPLLEQLTHNGKYHHLLLSLHDTASGVIDEIMSFWQKRTD